MVIYFLKLKFEKFEKQTFDCRCALVVSLGVLQLLALGDVSCELFHLS